MAKQDDWVRLTLRLPGELHRRLLAKAAESPGSMNAEIVERIEASFRYEMDYKVEEDSLKHHSDYRRGQLVHVQSELEFANVYQKSLTRRLLTLQREIDALEDSREANTDKFKGPQRD